MRTYRINNQTPHEITLVAVDGRQFKFSSNGVARCKTETKVVEQFMIEGCGDAIFERTKTIFGEAQGLPSANDNTLIIGSMVVAKSAHRSDVVSPGALVRNDAGQPIGAQGVSDPS